MKEITLKRLTIRNFKGLKHLEIVPSSLVTDIMGDNETGKSSVFDAVSWLWHGKDSQGRTDFDIKPLALSGEPVHKIETSVEGFYEAGASEVLLKRTYREKWVKKRGAETTEFTGHETLYEYNGVPCTQKEFNDKLELICAGSAMRLISQPEYFNVILPWQAQREILFELVGHTDWDARTAEGNKAFVELLDTLAGKTFDEYKRELAAKKKKIREELDFIPARIDEVIHNVPKDQNWQSIKEDLKKLVTERNLVDSKIASLSKANEAAELEKTEKQRHFHEKQRELWALKYEKERATTEAVRAFKDKKINLENSISEAERDIKARNESVEMLAKQEKELAISLNKLRKEWNDEDSKKLEFTAAGVEFNCPTCKRAFSEIDIAEKQEEIRNRHNIVKGEILKEISEKGKATAAKLEDAQNQREAIITAIEELTINRDKLQAELESLIAPDEVKIDLRDDPDYKALDDEVAALKEAAEKPVNVASIQELANERKEIDGMIRTLMDLEATKEQIDRAKDRRSELEKKERSLSQELATFEKIEFLVAEFTRAKVGMIETEVNKRFEITKFKMFDLQINGQYVETCQATYKGVPYASLNTAAKINVGLDIAYTFAEHFDIAAPIWVDNRESVSTVLTHPKVQLFNLIKVRDKNLTIQPGND